MSEQPKVGETELQKIKRDVLTRTIAAVLAAVIVGAAVGVAGAVYAFSSALVEDGVRKALLEDTGQREQFIGEILGAAARDNVLVDALSAVPTGAVVSFDRPSGCPRGWVEFEPAADRFIIGVGEVYRLPYDQGRPQYQTGGERETVLTVNQLPPHNHEVIDPGHVHPNWLGTRDGNEAGFAAERGAVSDRFSAETGISIADTGLGQAHNNMPPYIALYFCKKVAE